MFKVVFQCIPAVSILCFDPFSPFQYSPLLLPYQPPFFLTAFNTNNYICYLHSCLDQQSESQPCNYIRDLSVTKLPNFQPSSLGLLLTESIQSAPSFPKAQQQIFNQEILFSEVLHFLDKKYKEKEKKETE
jgi:hypothetical protein